MMNAYTMENGILKVGDAVTSSDSEVLTNFNNIKSLSVCIRGNCTGCAIKNWSPSLYHTYSNDRNPFNFKTTFICYYSELSFEVYSSFLG